MARWNAALAWATAVGVVSAGAMIGPAGCSSSKSGESSDASVFGALPPLGVAEPNCNPDACPPPGTCAGTLLGPSSPVSYCTVVCGGNSDCPPGNVCAKLGLGQCLPVCTTNAECSGGFACGDGGYCFSPYNGADAVPDAGSSSGGGSSGGGPAEAGSSNDAGAAESGGGDAGVNDASSPTDGAGGDVSSPDAGDAGADGPAE